MPVEEGELQYKLLLGVSQQSHGSYQVSGTHSTVGVGLMPQLPLYGQAPLCGFPECKQGMDVRSGSILPHCGSFPFLSLGLAL